MKRICAALLLTACGGENGQAEKDRYYEVLDSAGTVLYAYVYCRERTRTRSGITGN